MTDDQRKKYEEEAKQYMERIGYAQDSTMIAFFLAGCEFASKERSKQAIDLQDENKRLREVLKETMIGIDMAIKLLDE